MSDQINIDEIYDLLGQYDPTTVTRSAAIEFVSSCNEKSFFNTVRVCASIYATPPRVVFQGVIIDRNAPAGYSNATEEAKEGTGPPKKQVLGKLLHPSLLRLLPRINDPDAIESRVNRPVFPWKQEYADINITAVYNLGALAVLRHPNSVPAARKRMNDKLRKKPIHGKKNVMKETNDDIETSGVLDEMTRIIEEKKWEWPTVLERDTRKVSADEMRCANAMGRSRLSPSESMQLQSDSRRADGEPEAEPDSEEE